MQSATKKFILSVKLRCGNFIYGRCSHLEKN